MATVDFQEPVVLFHMTSDPFCQLPSSELFKLELLDGEVLMSPRPTPQHQAFVLELAAVLNQWVKPKRLGRLLPDTLVKLGRYWTPAPDLCFVATSHLRRVQKKRIVGPVDLAVEVLSPASRRVDRVTKLAAYARFGIPWYWIVDLRQRVLEEYELAGGAYGSPVKVPFNQPFKPGLFPGLTIDLASLEW